MKSDRHLGIVASSSLVLAGIASLLACPARTFAADVLKANNAATLATGTSWTSGTAPTSSDVAVWDSTVTAANSPTYGGNLSWQGIRIASPGGLVTLGNTTDTFTLTLGSAGINMSAATQNLLLNGNSSVSGSQSWQVASGRTLQLFTLNTNRTMVGSGTMFLTNATGSGTATFDLRPGSNGSSGFTAEAGVSGYTGSWWIGPNTVVKTLRNGINAWGNGGTVFLAGGVVGQQQNFNGAWTNTMDLVAGTTSTIDDFNSSGTRTLQLNGVIQGSGNITFRDTNAAVTTNKDSAYTLAATNTMSGTVTVDANGFLRVGGLGGNNNTLSNNVPAAGTLGTLGTAAVVVNGGLSFTRTDSWTVANAISGTGSVNIGSQVADLASTGSQSIVLSGSNTFSGPLTVYRGLLSVSSDSNLGAVPGTATAGRFVLAGGTLAVPSGFTISSNRGMSIGPTTGTGDATIDVASGQTLSYGGILANNGGTGGLFKSGSGQLTLSGANTYSGTTTIAGGVVKVNDARSLGGGSGANGGPVVIRSGTLDLGYTSSTGAYGSATLNFTIRTGNLTMGGQSGATSTLVTSSTAVAGGQPPGFGIGPGFATTLSYDATNNGGTATVASIWSAVGTSGVTTTTVAVGDSSATDVELDITQRMSATAQDDGMGLTLVKTGAGTMRISAANNFPGLTVSAGKLVVNHAQALGASRTNRVGGISNLVTNNATIDLNGFSPTVGMLSGSVGTFRNDAAGTTSTLTVGNSNNQSGTFAGAFLDGSGTAALTKAGTGLLTLSGSLNYSGLTTVSAGTLALAASSAIGSNLSGNSSSAVVQFGANTLTIGSLVAGNSAASFSGKLDGTGAVNLRGGSDSVVASNGAAGAAGNGFTLAAVTAAVPTSAFALDTGASTTDRKDFAYTNNTNDVLTLSSLSGFGGIRSDSGASNVTRFITVSQSGGDTTFNGSLTSHLSSGGVARALTLEKQGTSGLTLAGFIGKQTLSGNAGAVPVNVVANGGLLEITNASNTTTSNTDAIWSGTVTVTSGTLGFASQALVDTAGTAGVSAIRMDGGVLRWNASTVQDLTAGASSRLALVAGKTAKFDTNGNDVSFSNALGGGAIAAAVEKIGAGKLTLSANNTYSGATTVSAGTLIVNGNLANTSGLSVGAGSTLGGSGSISATLSGAGLVSPGNSPGITTANAVDPTGGMSFAFEFTGTGSPTYGNSSASVNDVLRLTAGSPLTSSLTSANVVDVYFDVSSLVAADTFRGGFYVDAGGDFIGSVENATYQYWVKGNGSGSDRTFNGQGYFSLANFDAALTITKSTVADSAGFASGSVNGSVTQFVVVPEPATLGLMTLGGLMGGFSLWKRRRIASVLSRS